jgi:hypothetical protein
VTVFNVFTTYGDETCCRVDTLIGTGTSLDGAKKIVAAYLATDPGYATNKFQPLDGMTKENNWTHIGKRADISEVPFSYQGGFVIEEIETDKLLKQSW